MSDLGALESLLEGAWAPVDCATESDYHALWHARGVAALAPVAMAVAGGALADRPAWVFAAGYQATLRNAFAVPADGWSAFAATEDAEDPATHPPTTLSATPGGYLLEGCKSWVGHSRRVAHLVVTVNDPGGDKRRAVAVRVAADAPGVVLTHREAPAFLPAVSQGYARFDRVAVDAEALIDFEPIRQFGRTEAKFVMLAGAAFMFAHVPGDTPLADRLLSMAAALIALLGEAETSRQAYGAVDREYQQLVAAFAQAVDTDAIPGWSTDGRLFGMYTARIQRRVGYARAERAARGAD